jgi:ribonuclease HI
LGSSGQVTWGIHVTGHEGRHWGGASPGDLKLSGVTLGAKEKVGGDKVENQELGAESLQACFNNGKLNAQSGSGIWFGPADERNKAIQVPRDLLSNQIGEIVAVIIAVEATPTFQPLEILTDSKYVINGLTMHLGIWEDRGWIGIKNAPLFKKVAHLLRKCTAPTSFRWVKGHNRIEGNKESDRLAKEGTVKDTED